VCGPNKSCRLWANVSDAYVLQFFVNPLAKKIENISVQRGFNASDFSATRQRETPDIQHLSTMQGLLRNRLSKKTSVVSFHARDKKFMD
jgi:hypothetical protein